MIICQLFGFVSFAMKAVRLSRYSDPDAVVENASFAIAFAIFIGPWSSLHHHHPGTTHPHTPHNPFPHPFDV
jgi:hypothetical protein